MAAGKHEGHCDDKYTDREYDRLRNGGMQARGRVRNRDKDVKDREMVNGAVLRRGDHGVRVGDREPGELCSESESVEAVDLEMCRKSNEGLETVNGSQLFCNSKKRKFSPIVWDRDDKEANIALLFPPSLPKTFRRSPNLVPAALVHDAPLGSPLDVVKHDSSGFQPQAGTVKEAHVGYIKDVSSREEDYVATWMIRSSRWANDADSLSEKGELFDDSIKIQQRKESLPGSVETRSRKQSLSPEVGEHYRENFEQIRGRQSVSDDDSERNDCMEIENECKKEGTDLSDSETESEKGDGSPGTPEPVVPSRRSVNMLQGCRSVDEFERLNKIDEGTYGVVYRAKDRKTREIVALKKVKMEKEREGFPLTSLREMNILLSFHHPSIVDVKEVVVGRNLDSIFMVMEYMEHDLKALMETMEQPFSQSEVKCLMLQLFEGTKYLHDNWVLHRDLKTSNLLLNNRGELKICDFGLSRQYGSPLKPYTHLVVTLWYRAPELLLGSKLYSTAIDMWSLGCIMAELLSKQPLFNGKTEFDQLDKIFKTLGTPNEAIWPGYSKLPGVKVNFVKHQLPALGGFLV
ncbi:hypothetical protein QVD17_29444 [Tagetes erecta]|uniref:cyclin-dependent kinase n=1 Tax=Tagetes erecta TaxID=13708 RepID=A0AAD8NSV3_TARER|nr:hypothetical protein QVD17_29444 [Tagetes erecta]